MNFITIGNVTLPGNIAAAVVAIFLAPLFLKAATKNKTGDWYWNVFFLFFLIAKLSYALFNWTTFIKSPVALLYFDGGSRGVVLGLIAVLSYLFWLAKKGQFNSYSEGFPLFHFFCLAFLAADSAIAKSWPASAVYFLLLVGTLFLIYRQKKLDIQLFLLLVITEVLGLSVFGALFDLESLAILSGGLFVVWIGYLFREDVSFE
ncbi:hypothetical protein [Bacillus sp. FJAT-27445]|uniref:hypothetical protein n=1 Tax=Bacillus sp. FJAT-27445 TaxID=1679166 RepID=UPI0007435BAF|nr:hypothetical protein [Bacillus sp. FJAT-27445]